MLEELSFQYMESFMGDFLGSGTNYFQVAGLLTVVLLL